MSTEINLNIRKATTADAAELARAGAAMFQETFAADNTPEDMQHYLDHHFTPAFLEEKISDPSREFYMAYTGNELAGYLEVIPDSPHEHFPGQRGLSIERIYVYKKFHDKKLGAALMQYATDLAQTNRCSYLWLGVWEKNLRAIAFYERWGFIPFGSVIFMLGSDRQTDTTMYKPLTGAGDTNH